MRLIQRSLLLSVAVTGLLASGCQSGSEGGVEIVNVSYDPTRELYQEINKAFAADYQAKTGKRVKVTQSHGGSGSQARAVIDGLKADVVTLALAGDIESIQKRELIAADWQTRLKGNASPYTSTIVFVVRRGNPKNIRDWDDLARPEVRVVTPSPKTSGGARWNFLAAWGYVTLHQGKPEADAVEFIRKLYGNVAKLDTGARGSTETFVRRKQGDVLIAWENEAILLGKEAPEEGLVIVRPSASIRAEPPVAVVDKVAAERGTTEVAKAYLEFLYTDAAQDIIGRHGYRPHNSAVLQKYSAELPAVKLFTMNDVVKGWKDPTVSDWDAAQRRFFADGGVFDRVFRK